MDIKKLLQPRFEAIADYPKSIFKIGEIIEGSELIYCDACGPKYSDYPHLFRRLGWWENRDKSEMPMYLKYTYEGETTYHKIIDWDMEYFRGWLDEKKRSCCTLLTWSFDYIYQPATEEEYLSAQGTNNVKEGM